MTKNLRIDHVVKGVKSEEHIFNIHEYDLDLKLNHIYLFGVDRGYEVAPDGEEPGIDFVIANRFIRNLNMCMRVNPDTPILIHQKSCGGDWNEGIAIYDAISVCPNPVTILSYTHARSMSSIILQAANKRVMMPHSYFMFHDGTLGIDGTVKSVESAVEFNKLASKQMMDIYANVMKRNGSMSSKSLSQIKAYLRGQMDKTEEVYLTPPQAVAFGLADEVFNGDWLSLVNYTEKQLEL